MLLGLREFFIVHKEANFDLWDQSIHVLHERERERDLPLLPWTKKALHSVWQPLRYLLWKKRDKTGITWVARNHLETPKRLGGSWNIELIYAYDAS